MSSKNCIFCNKVLKDFPTKEHILLSSLGGRKKTDRVICVVCNTKFSNSSDKDIGEETKLIRNLLKIINVDKIKKEPPGIKNIKSNQGTLNINSDGTIERVMSPKISPKFDDKNNLTSIQIKAQNEEEYKNLREHAYKFIQKRIKDPEIKQKYIEKFKQDFPDIYESKTLGKIELEHESRLISKKVGRGAAKMLLIFWIDSIKNMESDNKIYKDICNYIDTGTSQIQGKYIFNQTFPQFIQDYGPFYNLLYVESDSNGHVKGFFQLFGGVVYYIDLAFNSEFHNKNFYLVSNPLSPKDYVFEDKIDFISSGYTFKELLKKKKVKNDLFIFIGNWFKKIEVFSELLNIQPNIEKIVSSLNIQTDHLIEQYKNSFIEIGIKFYSDFMKMRNMILSLDDVSPEWTINFLKQYNIENIIDHLVSNIDEEKKSEFKKICFILYEKVMKKVLYLPDIRYNKI